MKRFIYLCGAVLCFLTGCHQTNKVETTSLQAQQPTAYIEFDQQYVMTLSDGAKKVVNEHIKMAKEPNKVIVLDMATLDSLYAVNIYQQIIGLRADDDILHHLPDYLRREFSKTQYISVGNNEKINFDMINKLSPEVIFIGNKETDEVIINQLRKVAPQAKIIYTGIDKKDYLASLKKQSQLLGDIFNKKQLYETYLKNIELDVDYIRNFDKKDMKLALVELQGQNVTLTTAYNEWLTQLGLGEHIYITDAINTVDMQTEEVSNQRIMIARESVTEEDSVVEMRQQQIDKEKHLLLNFDKNIMAYQPTGIIFIDDVIEENQSNMATVLAAQYMQDLSAIKENHYRVAYNSEWQVVNGGVYSFYIQIEDVVKLLQKIRK